MMMQRINVLLLYGGESSEHDVSLASARNVYAAIDNQKFDVQFGYIDRKGKWWLRDTFSEGNKTDGARELVPVLGSRSFMTLPDIETIHPDVILPVLHGKNGEDGSVAALGQLLHIPVVGCDMTAGAICMDKIATKKILAQHNINVVPYREYRRGEAVPSYSDLTAELGETLFVKPCRAGSSVGVSRVKSEAELLAAIELGLESDNVLLIERAIVGSELETAVLGTSPRHEISGVGEIVQGENFYTYEEKYSETSTSNVVIPADIDVTTREQVRATASDAYQILGCQGLTRIDFFLTNDGTIYVNELNTFPGFTDISMYPKLWHEAGVSYSDLVERLIQSALD